MATIFHEGWARQAHRAARPAVSREEQWFRAITLLFCLFAFRDMFTGAMRYYLALAKVSVLWFVPDILSFGVLGYFTWRFAVQQRSVFAITLVAGTISATAIGMVFMSWNAFTFFSGVKAFLPIYVGFALCGRSIVEPRWARYFLIGVFVISATGLLLAPYVDYPWIGQEISNFGQSKSVSRLWWIGEKPRYGGFAGDSTMAAFMVVCPYVMVHRFLSRWLNVALWPAIWKAVDLSTSRTAMLTLTVFIAYYATTQLLAPMLRRYRIERAMAVASFSAVLVPFVLMLMLGGVNIAQDFPALASMQDRIQNSWQLGFAHLADVAPVTLFTGCGLGCFAYPMDYTPMAYLSVPVDNFYLTTYLMMGVPFLVVMAGMFLACFKSRDRDKLLLITLMNVYSITVQCYGPSFATIMMGYAFSDAFLRSGGAWQRRYRGK